MADTKSVKLRFKQGASDKAYNVELAELDGGWVVNFAYGKYGKSLKAGTKTKTALPYAEAMTIYDEVVAEKLAKGYTADGSGQVFLGTENAGRVTGFLPQLLNTITLEKMKELVAKEPGSWIAQEKFDGERRGAILNDAGVIGTNRKGLSIALPQQIAEDIAALAKINVKEVIMDAEDMGDYLAVFDIVSANGTCLKTKPIEERLEALQDLGTFMKQSGIGCSLRIAEHVVLETPEQLEVLVKRYEAAHAEGVVFKRLGTPYEAGKPNSGGNHLKLKFTQDATVRVAAHSKGKRSVAMEVLDKEAWVSVGNVTIPGSKDIPAVGALIDVQYLYAYRGGALFQPVFKGVRTDLEEVDCAIEKLVYKLEEAA